MTETGTGPTKVMGRQDRKCQDERLLNHAPDDLKMNQAATPDSASFLQLTEAECHPVIPDAAIHAIHSFFNPILEPGWCVYARPYQ